LDERTKLALPPSVFGGKDGHLVLIADNATTTVENPATLLADHEGAARALER
jgi:hypothetical protein